MKLGEKVAFCLPSAGRKTQFDHLIFTQPGARLLEHPCIARCRLGGRCPLSAFPFQEKVRHYVREARMNEHKLNIFEKIEAEPPILLFSPAPTACESTKTTVNNVPRFRVMLRAFRVSNYQGSQVLLCVDRNQLTLHCKIKRNKVKTSENLTALLVTQNVHVPCAFLGPKMDSRFIKSLQLIQFTP